MSEHNPSPETVKFRFETTRAASRTDPSPSYEERIRRLGVLEKILIENSDRLCDLLESDYGARNRALTRMGDVFSAVSVVRDCKHNLKEWMSQKKVPCSFPLSLVGSAYVKPEPYGVVLIITPWNFPIYLAFGGLAEVLAAGNRVILKLSEANPRTADFIREVLAQNFEPSVVTCYTGDSPVATALTALPFDKILFTGGTAIGRLVAQAAAKNLTPVCLELGGKSPAIVGPDYSIAEAAAAIANGRLFNAGQVCVSPDYVLVPRGQARAFADAASAATKKHWGSITNPLYPAIITQAHAARVRSIIDDAVAKGATVVPMLAENPLEKPPAAQGAPGTPEEVAARKVPPCLILGATFDMRVLQEEAFGPLLPVVEYSVGDATKGNKKQVMADAARVVSREVAGGDRPLAMYLYTHSPAVRESVLALTSAGGVSVNDLFCHGLPASNLPFGGVGASGSGVTHGYDGFREFSHMKGVFVKRRFQILPPLLPMGPLRPGSQDDRQVQIMIKTDVGKALGCMARGLSGLVTLLQVCLVAAGGATIAVTAREAASPPVAAAVRLVCAAVVAWTVYSKVA
eukprot:TRINITY_DN34288_c0_g1_i1.p1 TRINITY_DN34288_c0_g1~~TRINITY_DN34288_c0_g1_i1.p1  ORF type:complete len:573 (+),score=126.67 TRINITY_DN34288_c0_g1_i1:180-1898(+)